MDKIKAVIYVRVSTDRQEYTRQINELLGYAKRHNIEIVHIFEEKESGFNSDRPEYNRLMKLTKDDIDTVMIWELSRLSRKSIEIQTDIENFTKKGINVFVYNKNLNTLNSDGTETFTSKLIISIIATMAEDEVKTSKQRSKTATVVTHTIDDKINYDFGGYKENTRTYNIKDFIDSFDTPDKRIPIK